MLPEGGHCAHTVIQRTIDVNRSRSLNFCVATLHSEYSSCKMSEMRPTQTTLTVLGILHTAIDKVESFTGNCAKTNGERCVDEEISQNLSLESVAASIARIRPQRAEALEGRAAPFQGERNQIFFCKNSNKILVLKYKTKNKLNNRYSADRVTFPLRIQVFCFQRSRSRRQSMLNHTALWHT